MYSEFSPVGPNKKSERDRRCNTTITFNIVFSPRGMQTYTSAGMLFMACVQKDEIH